MNYASFFSYIFLTTFTPGPNTIMAMSNSSKHGFKGGFRLNLGMMCGFSVVIAACAVFTSALYNFIPQIEPVMICIGSAYIFWLAWVVWRDAPHNKKKRVMQLNSITTGILLQFINVKVILFGITTMSVFILPHYKGFLELLPFMLIMILTGFAGTCCWSLFGATFEKVFSKHKKLMNALLALMLVFCALSQLSGLFRSVPV